MFKSLIIKLFHSNLQIEGFNSIEEQEIKKIYKDVTKLFIKDFGIDITKHPLIVNKTNENSHYIHAQVHKIYLRNRENDDLEELMLDMLHELTHMKQQLEPGTNLMKALFRNKVYSTISYNEFFDEKEFESFKYSHPWEYEAYGLSYVYYVKLRDKSTFTFNKIDINDLLANYITYYKENHK